MIFLRLDACVLLQWSSTCSDGHCCKASKPPVPESVTCNYIPATSVSAILTFCIAAISVIVCIAVRLCIHKRNREQNLSIDWLSLAFCLSLRRI